MKPEEILAHVRQLIQEHAGDNPDEWWYANRYVFARLNLDERKTKTDVKKRLFELSGPCHHCSKPFTVRKGVHLHRIDNLKGYSDENCVLMHDDCHEKYHKLHPPKSRSPRGRKPGASKPSTKKATGTGKPRGRKREFKGPADSVLVKRSQRYSGSFLYWWDITPGLAKDLDGFEAVEFICKDTNAGYTISVKELRKLLVPKRQTKRDRGNWGIKVLKDREDELAFEPGKKGQRWLFRPAVWMNEREED